VTPKEPTTVLAPVESDTRRSALLQALGFDRLSEGQRELALAISAQYDLDPMLRHVVMVDGKPYITRDGLLHVAHKSGDFDGIEVDPPTLDADGKYWRTICKVYRRSFSRPFIYPGRYPATGGNVKYNEEMAIKVAEVMTLRRAFDVSAPVLEERWDGDMDEVAEQSPPTSLAERIAQRALAAGNAPEQPETGANDASALAIETPETPLPVSIPAIVAAQPEEDEVTEALFVEAVAADDDEAEPEEEPEPTPVVSPLRTPKPDFVAPAGGFGADPTKVEAKPESLEPEQAPTDDADPLDLFKAWARDKDKDLIRAVARELFPNLTGFSQLNAQELGVIQHEVTKAEMRRDEGAASARCGAKSPTSESLCTLDPGHSGVHRHGTRESWV
jgi:hypothetical protein